MSSPSTRTDDHSARALTVAACASFVPMGITTVLLGPMLPALSDRWSLNYSQAGALFMVQYVASTVSVALSGVLAARCGFRFAIKIGLVLMAVGLAPLLTGPIWLGIVCIAIYGVGLGFANPTANLLVAEANPQRRSAMLNLLNFFWSTGAVACPFLVAAAARRHQLPLLLWIVAGLSLAVAIAIAAMPRHIAEPAAHGDSVDILPSIRNRMRPFLLFGGLFFLYVGAENGFGQWIASYSKSLGSLSLAIALMTPSFFYAAILAGRWIATWLLRTAVSDVALARLGLLLACGGMAGLIFSRGLPGIALSACAAGFGLSSVYPITISLLSHEFGSPRLGSFMFTLSSIGGGLFPWLVGISSTQFNTLKAGLVVPLLICATMFALYMIPMTHTDPRS